MRPILCDKCSRIFRGGGMTRVMRKIMFHFCPRCWRDREACEMYMRAVTERAKIAA